MDMNGTHQVLAYADDVNLIGDDIRTIERNAVVLLDVCKNNVLEVNIVKTSSKSALQGPLPPLWSSSRLPYVPKPAPNNVFYNSPNPDKHYPIFCFVVYLSV